MRLSIVLTSGLALGLYGGASAIPSLNSRSDAIIQLLTRYRSGNADRSYFNRLSRNFDWRDYDRPLPFDPFSTTLLGSRDYENTLSDRIADLKAETLSKLILLQLEKSVHESKTQARKKHVKYLKNLLLKISEPRREERKYRSEKGSDRYKDNDKSKSKDKSKSNDKSKSKDKSKGKDNYKSKDKSKGKDNYKSMDKPKGKDKNKDTYSDKNANKKENKSQSDDKKPEKQDDFLDAALDSVESYFS
ncbi:hypothetical protein K7432_004823 [Basidiobolus ranarum]|uniref:Uncharacterized protein n=1 Tax=Basidiobolus ranarum TaxID=34480 RepID=A0ABR2W409_9FUNG